MCEFHLNCHGELTALMAVAPMVTVAIAWVRTRLRKLHRAGA